MLVPCRNCGKEVGETAEICFNCGTKIPNRKNKLRDNINIGIIVIMIVLVVKYDDWFKKDPPLPEWFQFMVFAIGFICIAILIWLIYKAITDQFK